MQFGCRGRRRGSVRLEMTKALALVGLHMDRTVEQFCEWQTLDCEL